MKNKFSFTTELECKEIQTLIKFPIKTHPTIPTTSLMDLLLRTNTESISSFYVSMPIYMSWLNGNFMHHPYIKGPNNGTTGSVKKARCTSWFTMATPSSPTTQLLYGHMYVLRCMPLQYKEKEHSMKSASKKSMHTSPEHKGFTHLSQLVQTA